MRKRRRSLLLTQMAMLVLVAGCKVAADTQDAVTTLNSTVVPEASEAVATKVREAHGIDWVALPIPISRRRFLATPSGR